MKVLVRCKDGIEFEAYPKDLKEWQQAYKDLRAVVKHNTKTEVRTDGKRVILLSSQVYDLIDKSRKSSESWEGALLRAINKPRPTENKISILNELQEIRSNLSEITKRYEV